MIDKKTEKEINDLIEKLEDFLVAVPIEKRDAYINFAKAAYMVHKNAQMNEEFLKLIIPLLEPPDKKESDEKYVWEIMKQK